MTPYSQLDTKELHSVLSGLRQEYAAFCAQGLSLDMSRGKPSKAQLDLSDDMLSIDPALLTKTPGGTDTRNYGILDGLPEAKALFAELLEVSPANILVGGNSSLNLMFDSVARSMTFGVCGSTPWCKLPKVKFLCPVPGYDRHFAITQLFGIEMINIPMLADGPDMAMVKDLVENDYAVKGIWCVPMYGNPTGITYSDAVVKAFASLSPKAADFRIYWDNAYCVHHLTDAPDRLTNIYEACKAAGKEDMVYIFASTSKVTFSGGGVAVLAASENNLDYIKKIMTIQTIGHDKINQFRHVVYFKDAAGIHAHMEKHRALMAPKFDTVIQTLDRELAPLGIGSYHRPKGGYFVSFDAPEGCAKRICTLCKEAGVVLTPAGATFPYGKDPKDSNIRLAPSFPPVSELETAMALFCLCVKIAAAEKLLGE